MADLGTQILVEIRDEIRSTREEIRSTREELSGRIDQTNSRLDRLERRQAEGELRLGAESSALMGVMRDLRDKFVQDRSLRDVVVDHEHRLTVLEAERGKTGGSSG